MHDFDRSESNVLKENLIERSLNLNDWLTEIKENQPASSTSLSAAPERKSSFSLRRIARRLKKPIIRSGAIEILEVQQGNFETALFLGAHVDLPHVGVQIHGLTVQFRGWVLGRKASPVSIQFIFNQSKIAEVSINEFRPDVSTAYCLLNSTDYWGYNATLNLELLPDEGDLKLYAVLADGSSGFLSVIKTFKY